MGHHNNLASGTALISLALAAALVPHDGRAADLVDTGTPIYTQFPFGFDRNNRYLATLDVPVATTLYLVSVFLRTGLPGEVPLSLFYRRRVQGGQRAASVP